MLVGATHDSQISLAAKLFLIGSRWIALDEALATGLRRNPGVDCCRNESQAEDIREVCLSPLQQHAFFLLLLVTRIAVILWPRCIGFDMRTSTPAVGSISKHFFVDIDPSSPWLIRMGCRLLRYNELARVFVASVNHDVPEEHIRFGDYEKETPRIASAMDVTSRSRFRDGIRFRIRFEGVDFASDWQDDWLVFVIFKSGWLDASWWLLSH